MRKRVDVHAHCYPKPYLEELKKVGIGEEAGVGVKMKAWSNADERIDVMDSFGVDIQILSLSAPNVYFPDPGLSRDLAQMANDFLSEICKKNPDRFMSLASLPLNHMKHALDELDRAIKVLKMDGVMIGTNINQTPLGDDRFLPFFEVVNEMKVPVVLHPMKAIGEDLLPVEYRKLGISTSVNFPFETTRAIVELTFKGRFEKYRNVLFVFPHSGGTVPFLGPRWDNRYRASPDSHPLRQLPHPPSYYLKKHYYDTALSYNTNTLKCTIGFVGIDHVLFGTDSPYADDLRTKENIECIESVEFSDEGKEGIFLRNAMNIFPKIAAME